MIKGILFDLDDTLYDYNALNRNAVSALTAYSCEKLQVSKETFEKAFSHGRQETKKGIDTLAAAHNRMIYMQKTLEYLQINPFAYALEMYDVYWNYMLENMCLFKGAEELLCYLKNKGVQLAICTDLTTHIQHRKVRKLGLDQYINVIVTSEEVGVEKPNIKMFLTVLDKLKMSPDEVLYVGDSYERDMVGAKKCGMRTYWYNPEGKKIEKINMVDKEFKDYAMLRRLLEDEFEKY